MVKSFFIVVFAVALTLSASAGPHLNGTDQETFDHSFDVMLHGRLAVDQGLYDHIPLK